MHIYERCVLNMCEALLMASACRVGVRWADGSSRGVGPQEPGGGSLAPAWGVTVQISQPGCGVGTHLPSPLRVAFAVTPVALGFSSPACTSLSSSGQLFFLGRGIWKVVPSLIHPCARALVPGRRHLGALVAPCRPQEEDRRIPHLCLPPRHRSWGFVGPIVRQIF